MSPELLFNTVWYILHLIFDNEHIMYHFLCGSVLRRKWGFSRQWYVWVCKLNPVRVVAPHTNTLKHTHIHKPSFQGRSSTAKEVIYWFCTPTWNRWEELTQCHMCLTVNVKRNKNLSFTFWWINTSILGIHFYISFYCMIVSVVIKCLECTHH